MTALNRIYRVSVHVRGDERGGDDSGDRRDAAVGESGLTIDATTTTEIEVRAIHDDAR